MSKKKPTPKKKAVAKKQTPAPQKKIRKRPLKEKPYDPDDELMEDDGSLDGWNSDKFTRSDYDDY